MILERLAICAAITLGAGCGGEPQGPSAEQNAQMERAAEMLNQAPENLSRIDDGALVNAEDAAANQAAPGE